jgi:hypothetical protein
MVEVVAILVAVLVGAQENLLAVLLAELEGEDTELDPVHWDLEDLVQLCLGLRQRRCRGAGARHQH